jgi:hypothetical protein
MISCPLHCFYTPSSLSLLASSLQVEHQSFWHVLDVFQVYEALEGAGDADGEAVAASYFEDVFVDLLRLGDENELNFFFVQM